MSRPCTAAIAAVITACSLVLVACGSGGDGVATSTTRLTLLPATTTTEPPETTTTLDTDGDTDGKTDGDVAEAAAGSTPAPADTAPEATDAPTTTPAPETTTTVPVDPAVEALVLSEDGIGAAVFSGDPDGVVAFLTTFVGPPTADTGWVDPFDISACAGSELRVVSFGSLRLTFGDVSPVLEGRRHFFAYTYGTYDYAGSGVTVSDQTPTGLVTDSGIGLGTNLISLEATYPGLELNPPDDFFPETFVVNDNFRGALTGLADDSTVVSIIGGHDCADPT